TSRRECRVKTSVQNRTAGASAAGTGNSSTGDASAAGPGASNPPAASAKRARHDGRTLPPPPRPPPPADLLGRTGRELREPVRGYIDQCSPVGNTTRGRGHSLTPFTALS